MMPSREKAVQEINEAFKPVVEVLQEEYIRATGARARALGSAVETLRALHANEVKRLEALCQRLDAETAHTSILEQRVIEVERENQELKKQDLAARVNELSEEVSRRSARVAKLEQKVIEVERENQELKKNDLPARVNELNEEVIRRSERVAKLTDEISRQSAYIADVQTELQKKSREVTELAHELASERATHTNTQRTLDQAEQARRDAQSLASVRGITIKGLQQSLERLQKEVTTMNDKNTQPPATPSLLQKMAASPAVQTLASDADAAAWRIAGNQLVKLVKEPAIALLQRGLGGEGDDTLRERIARFLDTEIGVALFSALISAGLLVLPTNDPVVKRLAQELRIKFMAGAGDVVADVFMGPLRQVAAMYLQGVPTETSPAPLPGGEGVPGADFSQTARHGHEVG